VESEQNVYDVLAELRIEYTKLEHPPVFTVEEAEQHWENIEGAHCKNIFVRNKKGNRHFLIIVECRKKIDLTSIARRMGQSRFSFASPERMKKFLGLDPGSVSPFGLINDQNKEVHVLIDQELKKEDKINFHPNANTATLTLSFQDFERFLEHCGNKVTYLNLL